MAPTTPPTATPPTGPSPARPPVPTRPGPPAWAPARPRLSDRIEARTPRWLDIPWLGGIRVAPWVLLATVGILLTATLGSIYVSNHPGRLDYGTRSYRIYDRSAQLSFDVEKSPKAVAQCTVKALSLDSRVIGRRTDILVGPAPDGQRTTTVTTVVPTSERANAIEVEDCRITRKG